MDTQLIGPSKPQWRFTLAAAFGYLFLAAAYFSIPRAFLVVVNSARFQVAPSTLAVASFCWLALGMYYFFRRHHGALFVHATPMALVVGINSLTFMIAAESASLEKMFYICAMGAVLAMPLSFAADLWRLLLDSASPITQLCANLFGGVLLTAIACTTLRSLGLSLVAPTSLLNLPAMQFGAILGVWIGCYMTTSTCRPIANIRILGFSLRALAAGGLLGGLIGPLLSWGLAGTALGYHFLPGRLSPLFGIATALVFGIICWRPRTSENGRRRNEAV